MCGYRALTEFNLIDTKNNGFVNISEWISSIKRLKIVNNHDDELLYRRLFYYIIYQSKRNDETVNEHDINKFIHNKDRLKQEHPFYDILKIFKMKLIDDNDRMKQENPFLS